MKFKYNYFCKTALIIAIENKNIEIVKLLLTNPNIDVNNITKIVILYFYPVLNIYF